MKIYVQRLFEQLFASYWFLPGLMAIGAVSLAAGALAIDWAIHAGRLPAPGLYGLIEPPGARTVLSTVAGSSISVAGVVFSITIVVLSMASSQFGPRLLPNFMEHGGTQFALGAYVGVFIYSLLILGSVRELDGDPFVPQVAVLLGVALGVSSFLVLIYFIHHVSVFIQAPRIIDDVATRLEESLRCSFPERGQSPDGDTGRPTAPEPTPGEADGQVVEAAASGYIQAIDWNGLMEVATDRDLLLELFVRPGHFVVEGRAIGRIVPDGAADAATSERISSCLLVGPARTATQDPEFAVLQLVEIAVRALSPGVSDPFTAINCVDRLGAALSLLTTRTSPPAWRYDDDGRVRLVTWPHGHAHIVNAAFTQIRQAARRSLAVTIRLLETVTVIAEPGLPDDFRAALEKQVRAIQEDNWRDGACVADRADLAHCHDAACRALGMCPSGEAPVPD
jgi:uncharacterized membrane protein